jgi:hypothetical protein
LKRKLRASCRGSKKLVHAARAWIGKVLSQTRVKLPFAQLRYHVGIHLPGYRFQALKKLSNGMLDSRVYRRLHDEVLQQPDLDIVEIGGATGTASVAMGWALKMARRKSKVIVVEKCERGSREDAGGYAQNVSVLEANWKRFGVDRHLFLYPHRISLKNGHEVVDLISTNEIAGFVHDADGRIDRDFFLFWPRLREGGFIVVDDVEDAFQEKTREDGTVKVFGKRVLAWRLLEKFREWGLIEPVWEHHGTVFGKKPVGGSFAKFDTEWCEAVATEVYRECANRETAWRTRKD